ncbi:TlpA family protein disulfide reductase [Luteolibacter soli]|uniref:Thioredoxin domain-containing protein n=1 Tax=Luteolibacter soli TaxID=3135280 RepID=A0ABU9AMW6_9BACT
MFSSGTTSSLAALLLLAATTCFAQAPKAKGGAEEDPYASMPPKRAALERMLTERGTPETFEATVKKAREQGIVDQAILEARFLYHVDRREDDKIAAMLPEFLKRKDEFKLEQSEIFAVKEDWLAVVEYVQALADLRKNDRDGFKKHITEAFWLSPRQASAFAPHIDRLRMEEAMSTVKIDSSLKLSSQLAKDPVELGTLMRDHKALLLHFWSPTSHESEESMPDFKVTATELEKHKVAVASILVESNPEVMKDAKIILKDLGDKPPGAWLLDSEKDSLQRLLRVQNLPTVVLVSPEGSILFNGHPSEDELWEALSKLAPDVKRPAIDEH